MMLAHRLAVIIQFGKPIEDKLVVRHKCLNKNCVKFEHLEVGTDLDNAGDRNRDGTALLGSKNPNALLTEDQVREIYKLKETMTVKYIAEKFNVSQSTIYEIINGDNWSHITGLPKKIYIRKIKDINDYNLDIECKNGKQYILDRIDKLYEDNEEHWIWKLYKKNSGYGKCRFLGRNTDAHIASWVSFNGQLVPKNLMVRHKCKHKDCVNPDHLELGNAKQNAADRKRDGTQSIGNNHPFSIITEEIVREIHENKNVMSQCEQAEKYGVSRGAIYNVISGRSWSHVVIENKSNEEPHVKNVELSTELNTEQNVKLNIKSDPKINSDDELIAESNTNPKIKLNIMYK